MKNNDCLLYDCKRTYRRFNDLTAASNKFESENLQYYLEKNVDARERELERQAELEDKAPKLKAKSKMSKAEKEARKKQKMQAFQAAKQKSKGAKNSKRWN
ncbi:variant 3, ABC transporter F member 5 [Lathyrus oleraceus]|uniref:Variant 3, ABC transporter F member 5 n=1 Tax=Pisum sativum TaxID=3888 RepID=A0A9D4WMS5_PEA|nr:variant 3, ABC transporter F member 5 [Pisum sativum]